MERSVNMDKLTLQETISGSDKRKVSQDELRRLFQESGKLYAEEMIFKNAAGQDIDLELFKEFHEKKYGVPFEGNEKSLLLTLENLNLASNGFPNLASLLLFGKNPMKYIPLSQVIAVSFVGNDLGSENTGTARISKGILENCILPAWLFSNGI